MKKEPAPAPHARVTQASALDHVASVVRDDIRRGRYPPGARVVEAELQRTLGVSRGTVREALGRLAAEGLIDLHRFRGAIVRALSNQDIREILEMREVLEGLAARKAAMRVAQGHGGDAIRAAQQALDDALAVDPPHEPYLQANLRYHETLMAVAGSTRLAHQIDQLSTAFVRLATRGLLSRDSFRGSNDDHRAISAAILDGDGTSAEILMRAHIRRTALTLERLQQSDAAPVDTKS